MAKIPRVPVENQITKNKISVVRIDIKFSPCTLDNSFILRQEIRQEILIEHSLILKKNTYSNNRPHDSTKQTTEQKKHDRTYVSSKKNGCRDLSNCAGAREMNLWRISLNSLSRDLAHCESKQLRFFPRRKRRVLAIPVETWVQMRKLNQPLWLSRMVEWVDEIPWEFHQIPCLSPSHRSRQ